MRVQYRATDGTPPPPRLPPPGAGQESVARRYTGPVAPPRLPTVTLMQPTLVSRPFHREGLVYEEKVDGYRMVAHKDGAAVKLVSRQGSDHTRRYPDIVAAIRALEVPTLILDGEIAIFDHRLISRFEWLRHRQPPDVAHHSSWPSTACTTAARIGGCAHSPPAATCSRTCWVARTWCCRCAGWRAEGVARGR